LNFIAENDDYLYKFYLNVKNHILHIYRYLDSLKALYNYDLSSINTHNTQELKEDLIQKGLIKENFNEYFSFDEFNEKDPKEKQLDLDQFLNC
jgi:SOS response regulatory protein OraA/RecX